MSVNTEKEYHEEIQSAAMARDSYEEQDAATKEKVKEFVEG